MTCLLPRHARQRRLGRAFSPPWPARRRRRRQRGLDETVEVVLPDTYLSGGKLAIRRATLDDAASLALVTSYGFAGSRSLQSIVDDPLGPRRPVGEAKYDFDEQTWGAFEGDRAVSQLKAHAWKISGGIDPVASGVATPEFRRVTAAHDDGTYVTLFRGQPVAALLATQAAIYQRYGYSEAVRGARSYSIDTVDVAFVDGDGGSYTVGREPMETSLEPTLRRLYKSFTAGRACCYDWYALLPASPSLSAAG